MKAFPLSEVAVDLSKLELQHSSMQRALGVTWDIKSGSFIVNITIPIRPFTIHGIISVINTTYDQLGLISPAILMGRLLQRLMIQKKIENSLLTELNWDDPLPNKLKHMWNQWSCHPFWYKGPECL